MGGLESYLYVYQHEFFVYSVGVSARRFVGLCSSTVLAVGLYLGSKALLCIQLLLQVGQYKLVGCGWSSK